MRACARAGGGGGVLCIVNVAEEIHHHLRFYDFAGALNYRIEHELDLLQLKKLATVKGDAFTVFLYSGVLKDEKTLLLLLLRNAGACSLENKVQRAVDEQGEQAQTQQRDQCCGVVGQQSHGVDEGGELCGDSLQNAVQLRGHRLDVRR